MELSYWGKVHECSVTFVSAVTRLLSIYFFSRHCVAFSLSSGFFAIVSLARLSLSLSIFNFIIGKPFQFPIINPCFFLRLPPSLSLLAPSWISRVFILIPSVPSYFSFCHRVSFLRCYLFSNCHRILLHA